MDRRNFFRRAVTGTAIMAAAPAVKAASEMTELGLMPEEAPGKPKTNMDEILAIPRTKDSLPGKYPGKVVVAHDENCVKDDTPQEAAAYKMLEDSLLTLTGAKSLNKAWRQFVGPKDRIGLKVNPIGGKLLTTSHALVKSVIRQLEEAGIPRENIVIWDRRWEDLQAVGFTGENYPGVRIAATEMMDENGSFYGPDGRLYGEERIDRSVSFRAETEMEYDAYTMPYMVNGGFDSYLTKIVTQEVDKIINIPVLKNAGSAVTLCMKNLAFGSITNTARLHQQFWHETCAIIPCLPAIRDKVVLNIVDGMIGCFDGGPAANPQFICHYNLLMVGTDPVAVDRIGHDIVIKKRIEEGRQKEDSPKGYTYATLAESYGLGISDISRITRIDIKTGDTSEITIPADWQPLKDRTFVGSALYGYMNGGSDEYFGYGFQCLRVVTLNVGGHEYTVEIFRMDTPENAFGIYSQHTFKPLRTDALPQADHDCLSNHELQATKGAYYVSIVFQDGPDASSGADTILSDLISLY